MPAAARATRIPGRLLFFLFFLSGLSGLIYESIWSRYVRQFVGSAATAQVLVLSLFMGGMSVGALLAGRWLGRIRAPVAVYGIIEGAIGLYALAFPYLQEWMMRVAYDFVFPAIQNHGVGVEVVKWGMASLLVFPPCVLLGTTFPLMSVGILRRDPARSGEILSFLYFTNSFGAALGALVSGFVLVGWVGLPGTLAVAASINLAIMLVTVRERAPLDPLASTVVSGENVAATSPRITGLLFLAIAAGTGLSSFMYEIGWIRLLSMIVGSATHSFEVMLSAFVFGLALGGLWVRRRMDRWKRPELVLAVVQLFMGMSALLTLPLYSAAIGAMSWLLGDTDVRTQATWISFNVLRYLMSLLIMLPATFCAGMTLPLLTHVMLRRGHAEGVVGQVYGVNTLGAITGAVLAGLVLMPIVGLKGVIVIGAAIDMVLGVIVLRSLMVAGAPRNLRTLLRTATFSTIAMTLIGTFVIRLDPTLLTATVFRKGRYQLPEYLDILSYVDGRSASVAVVENRQTPGHRIIYTNGKPDASVILERWPEGRPPELGPALAGDEPNQFLVAILPLMVRPLAREGALIGFGSGVTCHTLLGSEELRRLDTIEIEPEMVRGARLFRGANDRAYDDPRNHVWYDDAKAYFAAAGRTYDFIVSEPTNPWVSGVASLFTVEFYREAKRYLRPDGVFAQWVQGYELSNELMVNVLAAVDQEFADYLIVRIGSRDWVILAVANGEVGRPDGRVLGWPGVKHQLDLLGIHDMGQVDSLIAANRRMLHPFLADKVPNTDRLPLLDTGAERTRFFRDSAELLHSLRWTPAPLLEVLGGIERRPYPRRGIGDSRDAHILSESEQATLLLRTHAQGSPPAAPEGQSPYAMSEWLAETERLRSTQPRWAMWLQATYDVYRETAPHVPIHQEAWWKEVEVIAQDAPLGIGHAVDLLAALSARDAERLPSLAREALADPEYPLPRAFVTIAGLIAVEIQGVGEDVRRTYARDVMGEFGVGEDSEDFAYRILRAYAGR